MFPLTSLQVAHLRAAELQHSAAKSRSARAVALAARKQDVRARRKLRAQQPDGPIVTAKPVRPAAVPGQSVPAQSGPAQPATQPAVALSGVALSGVALSGAVAGPARAEGTDWESVAADASAPVAVLTSCTTC